MTATDDQVRSLIMRLMSGAQISEVQISDDDPAGMDLLEYRVGDWGTKFKLVPSAEAAQSRRRRAAVAAAEGVADDAGIEAAVGEAMAVDRATLKAVVDQRGGSFGAAHALVEALGFEVTG